MKSKFTINEQRVLELFLNYPIGSFSAREIARLKKITHPTVLTALQKLKKSGLVRKETKKNKSGVGKTTNWKADQESSPFREHKKINNLKNIYNSDLIKKIVQETAPNCIVLFGSYSRGEDTEESDIDLFVQSKEKELNLKTYEHKLHRTINITFALNSRQLKKEFLQNIINGIVLHGYLEVVP